MARVSPDTRWDVRNGFVFMLIGVWSWPCGDPYETVSFTGCVMVEVATSRRGRVTPERGA